MQEKKTSDNVHDVSSREVNDTPLRQEASSPKPMCDDAVDQEVPKEKEDEHRVELHALGK